MSFSRSTCVALLVAASAVAGCKRTVQDVAAMRTVADSADQTLLGVQTNLTTAAGVKRGALLADTAYVLRDATLFAFRTVRITFVSDSGVPIATLTADRATLRQAQGVLDLTGNLTLAAPSGRMAHAQAGQYSAATNEIAFDSAVSVGAAVQHSVRTLTTDPTLVHVNCTPGPSC